MARQDALETKRRKVLNQKYGGTHLANREYNNAAGACLSVYRIQVPP